MRQPPVCEDAGYARLREELPPDQHADLRGAGADLVELGVAQQPARREVVDVAVAAQRLGSGLDTPSSNTHLSIQLDGSGMVLRWLTMCMSCERRPATPRRSRLTSAMSISATLI